jgi:hypothetical protein
MQGVARNCTVLHNPFSINTLRQLLRWSAFWCRRVLRRFLRKECAAFCASLFGLFRIIILLAGCFREVCLRYEQIVTHGYVWCVADLQQKLRPYPR